MRIEVQRTDLIHTDIPADEQLQQWAQATLQRFVNDVQLCIRIVDITEMTELNHIYRDKVGPTNVLSFPADPTLNRVLEVPLLGDIAICAEVVVSEAKAQNKPIVAHWAHLVIHGCLHLLGFDHENETDANKMEALEIELLEKFGFSDPYQAELNNHG